MAINLEGERIVAHGQFNGYRWYVVTEQRGGKTRYVAVCDEWNRLPSEPTVEMACYAARIWLSRYGR